MAKSKAKGATATATAKPPAARPAPSPAAAAPASEEELRRRRQVIHWRTLAAVFGVTDQAPNVESMAGELADSVGLPRAILDPVMAVDALLQRYPELKGDFDALESACGGEGEAPPLTPQSLRRELTYSKLLLNVFGPNTLSPTLTVEQYRQWQQECSRLGACFGLAPGALTGSGAPGAPGPNGPGAAAPGGREGPGVSGQVAPRLVSEDQLRAALTELEGDLMKRIALREILKDDLLAAQLPVSMPLIEQLLLDKGNLSGNALKNAKAIIRRYVDELAEVMKKKVERAARGKIDRSVPPKRVFRNLDLKRTIWKNLVNYNPDDARLHVNQLYYRQTGTKVLPKRLIIVVDQSGSMVDAMVQTAILASIFSTLPRVEVYLFAFDTNVIDLTAWVHEPFETLMRTNLGGGNDGPKAMVEAREKIAEPRNTTMVWISDFYEFQNDQPLYEMIKQVKESGVRFIPVGALKSGYFSVNEWFRDKLKQLGLPVLSGSIDKLIEQLRDLL